MSNKRENN